MAFIAQIAVARILGAESFGRYVYVITWINILVVLAKLGFDSASVRFIPMYNAREEWPLFRGFLTYSNRAVQIGSVLIALCFVSGVWVLRDRFSAELLSTLLIGSIEIPVLASLQLRTGRLQSLKRVVQSDAPGMLLRPVLIISGLSAAVFMLGIEANAVAIIIVDLAAAVSALTVIAVLFHRALPKGLRNHGENLFKSKEWFSVAGALMLAEGLYLALYKIDVILLGAIKNTTEAGVYVVASTIAGTLMLVPIAVSSILAPLIVPLHTKNSAIELQRIVTIGSLIVLSVTFLITAAFLVCGKMILGLYGERFLTAMPVLVILLTGQLFNALAHHAAALLGVTGYHKVVTRIVGFALFINIILNAALIPNYGAIGAAAATAVTAACWSIIMILSVRQRLGIMVLPLPKRLR